MRVLVAIPVYNEEKYIPRVISHVLEYADNVMVIDDGSTDRTPSLLAKFPVDVVRHGQNRGYGRSIREAFSLASCRGYDALITMDCDEQHEPSMIPQFVGAIASGKYDVVSGSRYLLPDPTGHNPPPDRRRINQLMTQEINDRLGLALTDSFCGFKAYTTPALRRLRLTEDGYASPMQFWVQAAAPPQGGPPLRIHEIPVRLIYNDPTRTFGGPLDDADNRLGHYRRVLHCELARSSDRLPARALEGIAAPAGCRDS
ncbi:MAG: glycosyltransferase family 2 protein [Phycisphaeraceae bacterium]|nr:glycosyltransferase family 2 protein [Phycisphaeraceae bacterium]